MSLRSRWKAWRERRARQTMQKALGESPLREFVYLDAVSLHSLLVSQNTTIPDQVSEAIARADEAELTGTMSADALAAKGQIAARYQTTNSSSLQSSRKAVIQTLFKEFRELPLKPKLILRDEAPEAYATEEELKAEKDPRVLEAGDAFVRGSLVEVEVELAVDPVFKLGSMMSEWSAMAEDYPAMFNAPGALGFLRESEPIMKILERFLAGLIPIKATATSHVVVEVDGKDFIADRRAVEGLSIPTRPLSVVGVTEHVGYWKDIRRVLFSGERFTMLCRVSRDGVQQKWTPVKLADLFSEVAPDFVDRVNAIKAPSAADSGTSPQNLQQQAMRRALSAYRDALAPEGSLTPDAAVHLNASIDELSRGSTSVTAQRLAFDRVRAEVVRASGAALPQPDDDLAARETARRGAGLELFPALSVALTPDPSKAPEIPKERGERMLDVEVIAIYW